MDIAKKAFARTQKFVVDHKVAIAVTATAATTVAVMVKLRGAALEDLHEFLDARGLSDEYINFLNEKVQETL